MSYIYLDAGFIQMLKVWMLRTWNAATLRVLRVCVWGVLEFVSSLFVEGWYVHHSNEKVQKGFATVSFADCHNISVAIWSLELRGVVMLLCLRVDRFQRHFLWLRFGHFQKKRRSCKRWKGLPASSGRICFCSSTCEGPKGEVKDWELRIPNTVNHL